MKPCRAGSGLAMVLTLLMAAPVYGQTTPQAAASDVNSIDAILAAVYDAISGPAGEPRDWDRFRSLFLPGAQLIPTGRAADSSVFARRNGVEQFVTGATQSFAQNPFYEIEVGRVTEQYGNIAHAFSTYESRRDPSDEPFVRGINSFQLLYDGDRWWVVNVFWADTRLSGPIPQKYMTN